MAAGMIFAALAFGAATLVEVNVVKTVVEAAPQGKCLLQVFNLAEMNVSLKIPGSDLFPQPIQNLEDPPEYVMLPLEAASKELKINVSHGIGGTSQCSQTFTEQKAYSLFLHPGPTGIQCKLVEDHIEKNENGNALLRFINTQPEAINLTVGDVEFHVPAGYGTSFNETVDRKVYPRVSCNSESNKCSSLDLGLLDFGASYTVVLMEVSGQIVAHKMEDVKANNVHIAWQIPQYILITAGEVMFSITGLEFSYSQAPANMKSVLQAGWLLTVAFGNVIVLIVAEGAGLDQWVEFLLFASLLVAVCIIFSIMSFFYTYVDPDQHDKIYLEDSGREEEDDNLKKKTTNDIHFNGIGESTKL